MDVLDTLRDCRRELEGIMVSGPGDWRGIGEGAAKWNRPLRRCFPSSMGEFAEMVKPPIWEMEASSQERPTDIAAVAYWRMRAEQHRKQEDGRRAADRKALLIKFLAGLEVLATASQSQPDRSSLMAPQVG